MQAHEDTQSVAVEYFPKRLARRRWVNRVISGRAMRETLSTLAVAGSLIFVGLELRQTTRVARAEAYRGFSDLISQWYFTSLIDNQTSLGLRGVAFEELRRDDLTDIQKWKVGVMVLVLVRSMETLYYQIQQGVLPPEAISLHNHPVFSAPYMADLWPLVKLEVRPEFAAFFEDRFGLSDLAAPEVQP